MATIGDRIKQKRKELGLTQLELGNMLNVTDRAVSKWEQNEGNPDIMLIPELAKVLDVSLDYLLKGKESQVFTLDDLDSSKRVMYLIEKDDHINFEKYGYVNSELLLCDDDIRDMRLPKNNIEIRKKIFECESLKIFGLLADKLLKELKTDKYEYPYMYYSASPACHVYDYLDDFVKFCALTNKIALLDLIKFKSFAVGQRDNARYYKANRFEDFYCIKQETLDFILTDKRIPKEMIEYVSEYKEYSNKSVRYSGSPVIEMDTSNALRMTDNLLLSLLKTKKYDLIDNMIDKMKKEAQQSHNFALYQSNDTCWRSSYYFGPYGYMFHRDGNGSSESTSCCGKITLINKAINFALEQKNKTMVLKLCQYNAFVQGLLNDFEKYKDIPSVYLLTEDEIDNRINEIKKNEKIETIKNDSTISDYDRRRKLFDIGALKLKEAIEEDDYELFTKFPFEETSNVSIRKISKYCKDIRFYMFSINFGQSQDDLDFALNDILSSMPDRYDIIDVLLSAGAKVKDNPTITAILKQNIQILNNQNETKQADIVVEVNETEKGLLDKLNENNYEYVIVNLTIQLEKKLKAKYGNGIQLLDMIDSAYNDSIINDLERKMLHNLRKARNMIMHEGDDKGFYTPEVIREWINIVFKI